MALSIHRREQGFGTGDSSAGCTGWKDEFRVGRVMSTHFLKRWAQLGKGKES